MSRTGTGTGNRTGMGRERDGNGYSGLTMRDGMWTGRGKGTRKDRDRDRIVDGHSYDGKLDDQDSRCH